MNQTLADGIHHAMTAAPEQGAIEFGGTWYTWGTLARLMESVESLVAGAGLGESAPVAVLLRNRPALLAAALQILKSQRCLVTINPFQGAEKVASDLQKMSCAVVIADPQDWATAAVSDAVRGTGAIGICVQAQPELAAMAVPGLDQLGAGPFQEAQPGVAVLMLSSGTTGPAKRIKLPSRQLEQAFANAAQYEKSRPKGGDGVKRTLSASVLSGPLVHIGGLYFALDAVLAGRPIALLEKFNVVDYARVLKTHRPKAVSLPPAALRMLLDANLDPELFSSIRAVRAGSAPLSPELKRQFETTYKVPVLDVYGATEFAGAVAGWSLDDHKQFNDTKTGSVGRAQAGVQLRVIDPVSGDVLGTGSVGILEVKSAQVDPDKWVRTTDLAEIDADGFLYIRGRSDDAVIRGGFKVLPREVEAVFREHPSVHEAAVVGIPEERLGAVPVAAIELKEGAPPVTEQELLAFARARLVAYQVPTQLRIVKTIPRTPSLKISQFEVKNLFLNPVTPA
jgi:acyl-CoA synthetase (AMP-forming)/AMP-acid ligase II